MVKICVVNGDDWSGLYVDGFIGQQGSSIEVSDIFEAINSYGCKSAVIKTLNNEGLAWLEDHGHLPESLDDISGEFYE